MNLFVKSSICSILFTLSASLLASESPDTQPPTQSNLDHQQEAIIAMAMAPIKSQSDLRAYVASTEENNPLDALTPLNKVLFEQGLTFNEKGITGFRYDVLETLTASQAYKVLSLFGVQHFTSSLKASKVATPDDQLILNDTAQPAEIVKGAHCESKGTCREDASAACTANC